MDNRRAGAENDLEFDMPADHWPDESCQIGNDLVDVDVPPFEALAAAEAAGYDAARGKKGLVLAEGSVLWKGYGVQDKVETVIRNLGGNLGFIKANGLIGAGLQALVEYGKRYIIK